MSSNSVQIVEISKEMNELSKAMAVFDIDEVNSRAKSGSRQSVDEGSVFDAGETPAPKTGEMGPHLLTDILEHKIDNLTVMLLEQNEVMLSIKKEVSRSNVAVQHTVDTHARIASELLDIATNDTVAKVEDLDSSDNNTGVTSSSCILLAGLNVQQKNAENARLKNALEEILMSETFREQLVGCTTTALRSVLDSTLLKGLCCCYMSGLKKSQCRIVKEVSKILDVAFRKLETNAAAFAQESARASRSMRVTLERHLSAIEAAAKLDQDVLTLVQNTVHSVLESEILKWREEMMSSASSPPSTPQITSAPLDLFPHVEGSKPALDQLMCAQIKTQLNDGEINSSFEMALSAIDLGVVMSACRSVDPERVFGPPCALKQNVLLSLIQQLSTDMVHETQLKCRYIEESIMSVEKEDLSSEGHVVNVFSEAKRNLGRFVSLYPSHVSARRLNMILLAIDSLLLRVVS